MKIYLAGSTAEIERAREVRKTLITLGFDVISTWIANVDKQAELFKIKEAGNPRMATKAQRAQWAKTCLEEAIQANVILFLVPDVKNPTRGAWFECGFALMTGTLAKYEEIIYSGDTKQSIFCALGIEVETDEQAIELLKERREPNRQVTNPIIAT